MAGIEMEIGKHILPKKESGMAGMKDGEREKYSEKKTVDFRELLEGANDAILIFDPEGEIVLDVNRRACEIYGFQRFEFIGMTLEKITKNIERGKKQIDLTLERGLYHQFESVQYRKDGTEMNLEINASVIDYKGKRAILSINRDVTEKKKLEERQTIAYRIADAANRGTNLKDFFGYVQRELGNAIDTKNFYIALYDDLSETINFPYYIDENYLREHSRPPRKFGKGLTEYAIKRGSGVLLQDSDIRKLAREGEIELIGTPSRAWMGAPLTNKGKSIGVIAAQNYENPKAYVAKDLEILEFVSDQIAIVIDKLQTEEALKEAEEKYRGIFENAAEGIYQSTLDGKFLTLNPSFARMLGYESPAEVLSSITDIETQLYVNPEKRLEIRERLEKEGFLQDYENQLYRKDGSLLWISGNVRGVKDEKGNLLYFEGVMEDITRRKKIESRQNVSYRIADATNKSEGLQELFKIIHEELGQVLDTRNFYIALCERQKEIIRFPYYTDENYPDRGPMQRGSRKMGRGMTEYVIKNGRAVILREDDMKRLQEEGEIELIGAASKVWVGVPLITKERIVGVLTVQNYSNPCAYTNEDLEFLEFVSAQIAIVIERKMAEEESRKNRRKIELLHDVALKMEGARTDKEIYGLTMEAAERILDFSIASIQYAEEGYLKIALTTEENIPEGYKMSIDEGIGGKTYRTGETFLLEDMKKDRDAKPTDDNMHSVLSVPIGKFGVFQALSPFVAAFNEEDARLAELLISHTTEALKRIESEEALKASKSKIEQLHKVAARMEAVQTEDEVCHLAMDEAGRILDFSNASIQYVEDGYLKIKVTTEENLPSDYKMSINEGIGGRTYRTGNSYLVDDLRKDKDTKSTDDAYRSAISVPIGGYGVFQAISNKIGDFTKEDLELAELLISHVAEALKRIRSEKVIRDSEERYRTLFDNIADPVMVFDQETHLITDCNSSFIKRYGYTLDELRQMTPYHLHPPEDLERVQENIDDKENIAPHEYTHITKGGERFPVEVFTQELEYKGRSAWISIMRDITERKQAENRQAVAYRIADAANRATNLYELFGYIRDELGHVIDTTNFYIALYNVFTNEVTFPYYIDEKDSPEVIQTLHRQYGEGLTEFIIDTGKAALFYEDDLKQRKSIGFLARTWLGVPLITRGNTIGVMAVQSYSDPHAYTQEDLEFMVFVSSQIAIVIERKQSEEKLAAIYDLSREMSSSLDLEKILEKVMDACEKVLDFKMISLSLIDEEKQELYIKVPRGIPEEAKNFRLSLKEGKGITVWVAKHRESLIIPDVSKDSRYVQGGSDIVTKSELAVPLKAGKKVIGVLNIESENLGAFSEDDRRLLETLAGQAAIAIRNAQLYEQAQEEIREREKAEKIKSVLYMIANATSTAKDMNELYEMIHEYLRLIVDTTNFTIALYDKENDMISFPYRTDEKDQYTSIPGGKSLTSFLIRGKKSLLLHEDDLKNMIENGEIELVGSLSKVWLGVPLKVGNEVIGALRVQSYTDPDLYTQEDLEILEFVSEQIAVAIERKKAEEELNTVHELTLKMTLASDMKEIAETVMDAVGRILEFGKCALILFDDQKRELYSFARRRYSEDIPLLRLSIDGERSIVVASFLGRRTIYVPDVRKDERYYEETESILSELCVPLKVGEKIIGVLDIESTKLDAYSPEDQMLLETLASECAVAILNAQLFAQAKLEIGERKQAEEKLLAINRLTYRISQTYNVGEIADIILDEAGKVLTFLNTDIFILDNEKQEIRTVARRGSLEKEDTLRLPIDGKGITAACAREGRTIYVPDIREDERYIRESESTLSELSVPMKVQEKTIGVFDIERSLLDGFTNEDITLAETLASSSAIAMQNVILYEEKERRIRELAALDVAFHDIMSRMDLQERLRLLVEWAVNLLFGEGGGLYLVDMDGGELELVVSYNLGKDFRGERLAPGEGLSGKIFLERKPMVIEDYSSWEGRSEKYEESRFTSILGVPIIWENEVIGIINVTEVSKKRKFTKQEISLLENFANTAAVVILNSRLYEEKRKSLEEVSAFYEATKALSSILDLKTLFAEILTIVRQNFNYDIMTLFLIDEGTNEACLVDGFGVPEKVRGMRLKVGREGIVGMVAAEGELQLWNDVSKCPYYVGGEEETRSEITVPLKIRDRVIGVMDIQRNKIDGFNERDIRILNTLAAQVSKAVENAKLYEEIKDSKIQLEFINDLMSHDISNINQIALGNVEMLSGTELSERQKKFLVAAQNAVRRSGRLVRNVKVLKRMIEEEEAKSEMELSDVITKAINEVVNYPGRTIRIDYEPCEGKRIMADSNLSIAFENLLDNAIKFTQSQNVRIAIDVSENEDSYKVEITDWGRGVSDQMKEHIFLRFERLSEGMRGTGLGLYATKRIVENSGGRVYVRDNPEGGSVFCVELRKEGG